jgi:hypothetical protein
LLFNLAVALDFNLAVALDFNLAVALDFNLSVGPGIEPKKIVTPIESYSGEILR